LPPLPLDASTPLRLFDPLVKAAVVDAGSQGEQPQALATLHGLCKWVEAGLHSVEAPNQSSTREDLDRQQERRSVSSSVLTKLVKQLHRQDRRIELEAVRAIATRCPRSNSLPNKEDGQWYGTFRDGRAAWSDLAREFAPQSPEVRLYRAHGAEVTNIELLLGEEPSSSSSVSDEYRRSAGGAMARMFFL
jgi:hypothetical protein